jgi:tyrosinase
MPPWDNEASPPTPRGVLNHHALDYTYDSEPPLPQAVALTVNAPAVAASTGQAGEVDVFSFVVGAAGNYVIETQGTTDVVMGLYGPNDMATLSVENDDGGVQGNSRISPNLSLGTYYVRVRHYSSTSAGNYSIAVQQSAAQPDIPIIQVNGPPS